jgi:chromate transporter
MSLGRGELQQNRVSVVADRSWDGDSGRCYRATMASPAEVGTNRIPLATIARQWARLGCIGFGGPPAHIALLRKLCVEQRGWLSADEFEDGVATVNLLPGPASTQLTIFCAWRLAGPVGALVGGVCFIVPGLIVILALSALFLAAHPPLWVEGAAAGAGAAVPAVAAQAALSLAPASWRRATTRPTAGPPPAASSPPTASPPATADPAPTASSRPIDGPSASPPQPASPPPTAGSPLAVGPTASPPSTTQARNAARSRWPAIRWLIYLALGAVAGGLAGPYLVLVLAFCGAIELLIRSRPANPAKPSTRLNAVLFPLAILAIPVTTGLLLSVAWEAFKVGALSYGGGFVIIPLMQHDVVHTYHWMTGSQFLSAVALGQVTPGPVVQTVSVIGYAAAGLGGALLASFVAFFPSFVFVLAGASKFATLRRNARVQSFLTGAGPAAIGAIAGSTIPLALDLTHLWQAALLALAAIWLIGFRKNLVAAIVGSACLGVIAVLAGAPVG